MDDNKMQHYEDLNRSIQELGSVFKKGTQTADSYMGLFNEFIEENELGLALHTICDYLLEADAPMPSDAQLEMIGTLHKAMELEDDCIVRLRAKKAT